MGRTLNISEYASWYIRKPNPERQAEGWGTYKKGWEIRLVFDEDKLETVHDLLTEAGFRTGHSYRNKGKLVLPLYGKLAVERFLKQTQTED